MPTNHETPAENLKRLQWEIAAKIEHTNNVKSGDSYWPNNKLAFSFWHSGSVYCYNSDHKKVARFKKKSWKK